MNVTQTVEGLERYPVNLRYPQAYRDSVQKLRLLPLVTPAGAVVALGDVAAVTVADGPPMPRSRNASNCRPAMPCGGPDSSNTWNGRSNGWRSSAP